MKIINTLIILLLTWSSMGQEYAKWDHDNNEVIIQNILNAEGKSKSDLTNIVKSFFVNTYKHGTRAIDFINEDSGTIVSAGEIDVFGYTYHFTLSIQVKDERLRYTVNNIRYYMYSREILFDNEKMIKAHKKPLRKIEDSIEQGLTDALSKVLDNDW